MPKPVLGFFVLETLSEVRDRKAAHRFSTQNADMPLPPGWHFTCDMAPRYKLRRDSDYRTDGRAKLISIDRYDTRHRHSADTLAGELAKA